MGGEILVWVPTLNPRSERMASAVTVSGIQVLSVTWKSADGTASQNMLRNDRITSSYFSHCCCSSPHAAEIWAPLVSTTLCADAADENRDMRPSTSVG